MKQETIKGRDLIITGRGEHLIGPHVHLVTDNCVYCGKRLGDFVYWKRNEYDINPYPYYVPYCSKKCIVTDMI